MNRHSRNISKEGLQELRKARKEFKRRERLAMQKYEQSLIRSDEEWEAIDEYLSALISKQIKSFTQKKFFIHFIVLGRFIDELFNVNIPPFDSKSDTTISYRDIQRFCKQHHFWLLYRNTDSFDAHISLFFKLHLTCDYVIII
jgi:hypothetical protein